MQGFYIISPDCDVYLGAVVLKAWSAWFLRGQLLTAKSRHSQLYVINKCCHKIAQKIASYICDDRIQNSKVHMVYSDVQSL